MHDENNLDFEVTRCDCLCPYIFDMYFHERPVVIGLDASGLVFGDLNRVSQDMSS